MSERNEYSVVQWFPDGTYDYIKRYVGAQEAVETCKDYSERPAAIAGFIQKLIVEDGGGDTCFMWEHGKGVTYPKRDADGKFIADEESAG